jgi:hypothetical protein
MLQMHQPSFRRETSANRLNQPYAEQRGVNYSGFYFRDDIERPVKSCKHCSYSFRVECGEDDFCSKGLLFYLCSLLRKLLSRTLKTFCDLVPMYIFEQIVKFAICGFGSH